MGEVRHMPCVAYEGGATRQFCGLIEWMNNLAHGHRWNFSACLSFRIPYLKLATLQVSISLTWGNCIYICRICC